MCVNTFYVLKSVVKMEKQLSWVLNHRILALLKNEVKIMIKIFISQPMRDKTKEEILAELNKAISLVKEKYGEDAEIIDSYFADFEENKYKIVPLAYLAKSIELLSTADVAVFCKGWENARGCKIENQCAIEYGIPVMFLDDRDIKELI